MECPTVWFNHGLINLRRPLGIVRAAMRPGEFRLVCTSRRANPSLARLADDFEIEPRRLSEEGYVAWALDTARRHRVALFVPGHRMTALVRARQLFEATGTRLLAVADANTLEILRSKKTQYETIGGDHVAVPDHAVVNTLAEFDAAWARMRSRHDALCFKPAVSVYGLGFRIVADTPALLKRHRAGDPLTVSLAAARRRLAARGRFPDLLLMEYLPGPERSIDCLARDGELLRCVVRRKPLREGLPQRIEDYPHLAGVARRLTARLRLNGLFNIQVRDRDGRHYLLEINPRMSGGLRYSCRSGLAFPYWAIRLALGTATPEDLPEPQAGLWVATSPRVTSR